MKRNEVINELENTLLVLSVQRNKQNIWTQNGLKDFVEALTFAIDELKYKGEL